MAYCANCNEIRHGMHTHSTATSFPLLHTFFFLRPAAVSHSVTIMGLFGTAHNNFMSCCELFYCQTLISKTTLWVKLFFLLLSQRHELG